jgi:sulfide dehydrogenase [flavocytochrome c] flavoprotein subunit
VIGRRTALKSLAGLSLAGLAGCAGTGRAGAGHVVVVGGGFGGATTAKYLRLWSRGGVRVTLVERNTEFISCPLSNLVLAGAARMADLNLGYGELQSRWGVRVVGDEVVGIDPARRSLTLAANGRMGYDRLVLSPGVDFLPEQVPGLRASNSGFPTLGRPAPRPSSCAGSLKPCRTAAYSPSTSPRPPTAARPAPTNGPAWSLIT